MNNIILDNRMVSDYTFATRFRSFLKDIKVNDACSYDELEYLQRKANALLKHQIETATDKYEVDYLNRIHPELIKNLDILKNANLDFEKYKDNKKFNEAYNSLDTVSNQEKLNLFINKYQIKS